MKVLLLAGGKGTRLSEETRVKPKPMVEIGGIPILVHIMRWYASFGHNEFVVACGYLGDVIKEYFAGYSLHRSDFTISTADGTITQLNPPVDDWKVTLVDTGEETMTGGRIARLQPYIGDETFMMTYGDGVSDVNLDELLESHRSHQRIATVTAVLPPARFGSLVIDSDDGVSAFQEKVAGDEAWINGGFFVLEPAVFEFVGDDTEMFEQAPLRELAQQGELSAYRHGGFWKPMDTLRDKVELERMYDEGDAPWVPR